MEENGDEDTLVRRRSRRSTAGNWMEAALAEFASQNAEPEVLDDDNDFVGPDDEVEVFDSDFQSTDDEAIQEDEAAGEKEVVEEEKQARRSARHRAVKAIEVSTARQTTMSGAGSKKSVSTAKTAPKRKPVRGGRRVSVGVAIDAETGKVVETSSKRMSRRKSTILSSQNLHSRLKDAEVRKAAMPKRTKEIVHTYTQAELIARALDTEEGNIIEHRDYLKQEEEKRARARVVRKSLAGPVLRWVSRTEEEKVQVESLSPRPTMPTSYGYGPYGGYGYQASTPGASTSYATYQPYGAGSLTTSSYTSAPYTLPLAPPQPQYRIEKVNKNYLVHELDQHEGVPKPEWGETMSTVFGGHVNWAEVKVYSGKHRPLSRPVTKCPLTGRPAIYRDPRSGVPFANVGAFKTLTHILSHEYIWNEELRCYTANEKDIDENMGEAPESSPR